MIPKKKGYTIELLAIEDILYTCHVILHDVCSFLLGEMLGLQAQLD